MITGGKFLLCAEEEDSKHILLKCSEAKKKWTEKLVCSEELSMNNNVNTYSKLYDNGIIVSQMRPPSDAASELNG
jgi:hypothetical protein